MPDNLRATLADLLRNPAQELHTNPRVGHIAGVGETHPERLTVDEIRSLCGEVMRHIRRMQGKG